jgi:hypothetical protein
VNFDGTFLLVAILKSMKIMLAITTYYEYEI